MPFSMETSINLADDPELMRLMTQAGFDTVFVGIETPNEDSLTECSKNQNKGHDLVESVKTLQRAGLQVNENAVAQQERNSQYKYTLLQLRLLFPPIPITPPR